MELLIIFNCNLLKTICQLQVFYDICPVIVQVNFRVSVDIIRLQVNSLSDSAVTLISD
jgi:hypothetical protein